MADDGGEKKKRRGLFGRGGKDKSEGNKPAQAVAPPPLEEPPASGGEESSGGLKGWLIDSYNGLFKIVIEPQLPRYRVLGYMIAAMLFGIFWAWSVNPIQFYDGAPNQLSSQHRDQYVKLIAGSADQYDDAGIITLLQRIENPEETVRRLIDEEAGKQLGKELQNILPLAQQAGAGTKAPSSGGSIISSVLGLVIAIIAFIAVSWAIALLWGLLLGGYVMRFWERIRPKSEEDKRRIADDKKRIEEIKHRKELEAKMKEEAAASDYGPPLTQKISVYTKGRQFDDSFAIEDESDMFLGECGATIGKTIGDTQELTAIEIWLFDKDDFVKTYTKLFASQHAYNDPVLRADLDSKVDNPDTDIVVMQPGTVIALESNNLRIEAKIADLKDGSVATLPPNSHFDELTIQVSGWQKAGGAPAPVAAPPAPAAAGGLPDLSSYEIGPPPDMPSAPPPATGGGLPDLSSYEIGPPPEMPSAAPPPKPASGGGLPDLSSYEIGPPPPMPSGPTQPGPAAPKDDEDPFGGTGDFTPLGS